MRLVLDGHKTNRFHTGLANFASLSTGLNWDQSRWSQQHIALSRLCPWNNSHCGNSRQSTHSRDRGRDKEATIAWVKIEGQLVVMSSWLPPLALHPLWPALLILHTLLFCSVPWAKGFASMGVACLAAVWLHCRQRRQQQSILTSKRKHRFRWSLKQVTILSTNSSTIQTTALLSPLGWGLNHSGSSHVPSCDLIKMIHEQTHQIWTQNTLFG